MTTKLSLQRRVAAVAGSARAAADGVMQLQARNAQRGRDAAEKPREHGDARRERQHDGVHPDFRHAWKLVGRELTQEPHPPEGQREPGGGAGDGEHQALDEQLCADARGAGAETAAHRQLLLAGRGAHQHEVGDVGASDEEYQANGAEQHEQRSLQIAGDALGERHCDDPRAAAFGVGEDVASAHPEVVGNRHHLARDVLCPEARPHAADDAVAPAIEVVRLDDEGRPELGAVGEVEARGHDADHGGRPRKQLDGASHERGVAGEAPLPQRVAQDDCLRGVGHVLAGGETPAEHGPHADNVEEVAGDGGAVEAFGVTDARERGSNPGVGGDPGERARLRAEDLEHPDRHFHLGEPLLRRRPPECDEAIRLRVWQRTAQNTFDGAEDQGARSNAEREGGDGHAGESRVCAKGTQRVAHVVPHMLDKAAARAAERNDGWRGPHEASKLRRGRLDPFELDEGGRPSRRIVQSTAAVV